MKSDYVAAHKHCTQNRAELLASEVCGCSYCARIFPPSEIELWLSDLVSDGDLHNFGDSDDTAICPFCGIDSVIGSKAGYPINSEFMGRMRAYWF
jgi:hypothetical protein